VQAGDVEVKKRVETERVREPVTLRGEEVEVERRPVTGTAASRDVEITAKEVRVPVTEEEAIVEKRPVVKEEVVISKHPTEHRETVEADTRKERIDIERHGDVRAHEKDRERKRYQPFFEGETMADIDVVPKSKSNMWLWIIAAIVLAVVLWVIMATMFADTPERVGQLMTEPASTAQAAFAAWSA
jgi:uncharacterized protein (TIGR02271 family)